MKREGKFKLSVTATAMLQIGVGIPVSLASGIFLNMFVTIFILGLAPALGLDAMGGQLFSYIVAFPAVASSLLLVSSAVVYAIGRIAGYRGRYWWTLLGGVLPTAVLLGAKPEVVVYMAALLRFNNLTLFGVCLFLIPILETVGFHLSTRTKQV